MTEAYVIYSSATLFAMGVVALFLSVLFRERSQKLNSLPNDLQTTIFSQTFVIFDPYPTQKKVINRFLSVLPFVGLATALAAIMAVWRILTTGFLLSLFTVIIGLNVITIEEAPEVYMNTRIFVKAVQNKSNFADGDLKVLRLLKKLTSKISKYYLGLSTVFILASITFPYAWEALPGFANWLADSVAQSSGVSGMFAFQMAAVLLIFSLGILQFFAFKLKNKIFRYETK